jgi:hypothetical protein
MNDLKVQFIYAYPFDVGRRKLAKERNIDYPSFDKIIETKKHWENIWEQSEKENNILNLINDLTKRLPDRSLECFIVGGLINPMSTPFLMSVKGRDGLRTDEQFIDTMIHEILHIFVSGARHYFSFVNKKYSNDSKSTQNHIIIYAMLEKIYEQFFNSKPLDYLRNDMPEGYARAIEIVKQEGFENIINEYHENLD